VAVPSTTSERAPQSGVRELRLAVVCYGGVSLAIYMHGVTKEIHKLVQASAALAEDGAHNPFPAGTERVYWDLLARIERGEVGGGATGTRLRVVVDIISGTSAGGINGVFLAKALAHDRSQDALKQLWFEKGDIKELLRGWRWVPAVLRAGWIAYRAARAPLKVQPPLRGDDMCRWLHSALDDMDSDGRPERSLSLVPDDLELQLFVPITDFHGYDREIPLYDPRFIRDRTHRHVMQFRYRSGDSELDARFNHALAFAARATSSFPGAFPPIDFAGYERCFSDKADLTALAPRLFPLYALAGSDPAKTHFVDGGVLDNFPFQSSIDAIAAKPAASEVDRRLLYIEPDPGEGAAPALDGHPPSLYKTIFGGYASIPRKEPILDDLLKLARRNEAVLRVRDVIESSFDVMRDRVDAVVQDAGRSVVLSPDVSGARLAELDGKVQQQALAEAGFGAGTYLRLRVRSMIDAYSAVISSVLHFPLSSFQAAFVTSVLRRWAVEDGLLDQVPNDEQRERRERFLTVLDLQYRERRIRFLVSAVSWLYPRANEPGTPSRAQLDDGKRRLYRHVARLRALVDDLASDAGLVSTLRNVFSSQGVRDTASEDEFELAAFLDRHRHALVSVREAVGDRIAAALPTLDEALHRDVLELVGWSGRELRRDLLTRYLGFPFWDLLVYPLEAMSGVGERDHVEVYRMSPQDATLLDGHGEGKHLAGKGLFHFGAFFSRRGREGDYLWGRLDAAERLIKLLLDVRREPSALSAGTPAAVQPAVGRPVLTAECVPAFQAVLDEEVQTLANASKVVATVRRRVDGLRSHER
jgi:patatin-related protein